MGGRGAEQLIAGDGNDVVDGRRGNDTGRLGSGDDRFSWDPGDGNDTVEGSAGTDALAFDGSRADEAFRISPNQLRARLVRDVGGVVMNLGTLEQIDVRALRGADTLTTDELAGTTLQAVTGNLGDADGATDRVVVNGTGFDDTIEVAGADGGATVLGLTTPLSGVALAVTGAQVPADRLSVSLLAGDDIVDASGLAAGGIALRGEGGGGDDMLIGSAGADFLRGEADDDVLVGGPANDDLDGGAGNNTVIQD